MTPLRIVIIAILLYIGFRMIFGGRKNTKRGAGTASEDHEFPASDVLVEDPICHSLVPKGQAVTLNHRGGMVYFCSEECCRTYIEQQGEER